MTKQEEIREYFESGLCCALSQEFCSDCHFSCKNGDYCDHVHEQVTETLRYLDSKDVRIRVGVELPEPNPTAIMLLADEPRLLIKSAQQDMLNTGFAVTIPLIEKCPS